MISIASGNPADILVVTLLRSNTHFDAIIALKIGNQLAILKIVKNHPCADVV